MTMTLQEVFNKAAGGVLAQGARATSGCQESGCVLRSESGNRCAVGQFVEESEYLESMEFDAPITNYLDQLDPVAAFKETDLGKVVSAKIGDMTEKTLRLLYDLQNDHDVLQDIEETAILFVITAGRHGLDYSVVQKRLEERARQTSDTISKMTHHA